MIPGSNKSLILLALALCLRLLTYAQSNDSLLQKGISLYAKGNYQESLTVFEELLKKGRAAGDKKLLAVAYNNLGNIFSNTGKPVEALSHYQQSVYYAEKSGDKKRLAKTIKNIGTLYEEQNNLAAAYLQYERAGKIAKEINDSLTLADCANNKGIIHEIRKEYRSALVFYKQALSVYYALGIHERIALTLNNIGIVYKHAGNYQEAIRYYEKSKILSEQLNDQFMIAANYANMANAYLLKEDYLKAVSLNMQSLEIARKINAVQIIASAYESLAQSYEGLKNYAAALDYHKKFKMVNDSTFNIDKASQLAELQTKYETTKKEEEIQSLKAAQEIDGLVIEKRNNQVFFISSLALLIAIMAILIIRGQRIKQQHLREKERLETEHKERLRISKDMHDDLGSGLSKIAIMSELVKTRFHADENLLLQVNKIASTADELVDKMSHIVWAMNPEYDTLDSLLAYVREFASDLFDDTPVRLNFGYPDDENPVILSQEIRRNVFLVIKESLHNVLKHAKATRIDINVTVNLPVIIIKIADNGGGFDVDNPRKFGNGLINMKKRMHEIKGLYHISSVLAEGTTTTIEFKI